MLDLDVADLFPVRRTSNRNAKCSSATSRSTARSGSATPATTPAVAEPQFDGVECYGDDELRTVDGAPLDWAALVGQYEQALTSDRLAGLSTILGVPEAALQALHIGWRDNDGGHYTFPEFDGERFVIGISTRAPDGNKRMLKGSRRGLYLPTQWRDREGPIFIAEGASCTAALTAMSLAGIGRPSADAGVDLLGRLLADISGDREIVVLGEYDPKPDGSWPGRDGAIGVARKLSDALGRAVRWVLPPGGCKDAREWFSQQRKDHP